jgi:PPK2 family polyphosphate:nucleotide phosphotransferase
MKINTSKYKVKAGSDVKLKKWPTQVKPLYASKEEYKDLLDGQVDELSELQQLLYASNRHSVLLIFQAMDAAGKDGAIQHVMSGVNPQGCQVFSFKHPSAMEFDHDFLWRYTNCLPERGRIGIFNRSYYEDVLVVRVHPELLQEQGLPTPLPKQKTVWEHRYESITGLEQHLQRNGTTVIKFFLHLSKEEQRKRFLSRIDEPSKQWKFGPADIAERQFWDDYMNAYEHCLSATSSKQAPWFVVPADDKENARLIIAQVVLETLQSLDMHYPESDPKRRKELLEIRKKLAAEAPAGK